MSTEIERLQAENKLLRVAADPAKVGAVGDLVKHATRLVQIERDDARAERDALKANEGKWRDAQTGLINEREDAIRRAVAAENERDALKAELAATKEQLRLANIDAQNNEAERADAEDYAKKLRAELAEARAAIEKASGHLDALIAIGFGATYDTLCDLRSDLAPQRPEDTETADNEADTRWRRDEQEVDGGFTGCEFPRLWPPRQRPEDTREETGRG